MPENLERSLHEEQVGKLFAHRRDAPKLKLDGSFSISEVQGSWNWKVSLGKYGPGADITSESGTAATFEDALAAVQLHVEGFLEKTAASVQGPADHHLVEVS